MLLRLKRFFYKNVLRKKYIRSGECNGCGACCTHIYVKHMKGVVKSEEEFNKLRLLHPFYTYLKVIGEDETGLFFECTNLDYETKKCKIHSKRPGICRRYPQEEIFLLGGTLKDDCGYSFEPIDKFEDVLNRIKKRDKIKFRPCLNFKHCKLCKLKECILGLLKLLR